MNNYPLLKSIRSEEPVNENRPIFKKLKTRKFRSLNSKFLSKPNIISAEIVIKQKSFKDSLDITRTAVNSHVSIDNSKRKDAFGTHIIKGSKNHKVTMKDDSQLVDEIHVENFKDYNYQDAPGRRKWETQIGSETVMCKCCIVI